MTDPTAQAPSASLAGRAAFTIGAIALALAVTSLPMPFVEMGGLETISGHRAAFGLFALGLIPFLSASVLVELLALASPRLRPLRHGSAEGRARLSRASWPLAAALAALQAWSIVTFLRSTRGPYGQELLPDGALPALGVGLSLVTAALLLALLADQVSRRGLGNGIAVLLAAQACEDLVREILFDARAGAVDGGALVLWLGALAAILVIVAKVIRGPKATTGPRVPIPTSGLVPVYMAASLLLLPATAAAFFPALTPIAEGLYPGSDAYWITNGLLALALTALLGRLFCSPAGILAAWSRASPGAAEPESVQSVRSALAMANRGTVLLVAGLVLAPLLPKALGVPSQVDILALALVTTVVLDLIAEVQARSGGARMVTAHPLHRVYAVDPILAALRAAGIPAFARMRHFRALFHFFAPYVPIEIMVPSERAAEADAIAARIAVAKEAEEA